MGQAGAAWAKSREPRRAAPKQTCPRPRPAGAPAATPSCCEDPQASAECRKAPPCGACRPAGPRPPGPAGACCLRLALRGRTTRPPSFLERKTPSFASWGVWVSGAGMGAGGEEGAPVTVPLPVLVPGKGDGERREGKGRKEEGRAAPEAVYLCQLEACAEGGPPRAAQPPSRPRLPTPTTRAWRQPTDPSLASAGGRKLGIRALTRPFRLSVSVSVSVADLRATFAPAAPAAVPQAPPALLS